MDNDANLGMILDLKTRYPEVLVGYSDHTEDGLAILAAVARGAKIVERHIGYWHQKRVNLTENLFCLRFDRYRLC